MEALVVHESQQLVVVVVVVVAAVVAVVVAAIEVVFLSAVSPLLRVSVKCRWFSLDSNSLMMLRNILDETSHLLLQIFVSCPNVCLLIHSNLSRMFPDVFSARPLAAVRSRSDRHWHSNADPVYKHRWRSRTVNVDCVENAPQPCGVKRSRYHPLRRRPSMVQWWTRSSSSPLVDQRDQAPDASRAPRGRRGHEYSYLEIRCSQV